MIELGTEAIPGQPENVTGKLGWGLHTYMSLQPLGYRLPQSPQILCHFFPLSLTCLI